MSASPVSSPFEIFPWLASVWQQTINGADSLHHGLLGRPAPEKISLVRVGKPESREHLCHPGRIANRTKADIRENFV